MKNGQKTVHDFLREVIVRPYGLYNIDANVANILSAVGTFIDVDRCYVFEFTRPGFCSNTYEWCSPRIEPQIDFCQDFDASAFDMARIESGRYFVDDVSSLPASDRSLLEPQGIKALAILPMITRAGLLGFVGYDECRRTRAWTDEEMLILQSTTTLLLSMIQNKHAEKEARQLHEMFRIVLDNMDIPIYVSDMESCELLFANLHLRKIYPGIERSEGKPCWSILQQGQVGRCPWCPTPKLLDEGAHPGKSYKWEFQNTLTKRWYLLNDSVITWVDGRQVHMEMATDITELKRNEERLRRSASTDGMTGAYNREWGYKTLDETLRMGIDANVLSCLCFLDLDNLKQINDLYGHDEGDHFIVSFVRAIRSASRGADVLCRWGGDEFLLCLYDCSERQAKKIMGKIGKEFAGFKPVDGEPYDHNFSYGIIEIEPKKEQASLEALIAIADESMYAQKMAKKNR